MKSFIRWTIAAIILMIGCPWLTVAFAGSSGLGVCFLLFFAVNPVFAAVCGAFAGTRIKQLWALPLVTAGAYLAGVWIFFEIGEPAFLLYAAAYLVIGALAMLVSSFVVWRKRQKA